MLQLAEHLKTINHPAVRDVYLKREFKDDLHETDVLIIEANHESTEGTEHDAYDSYIIDILTDLHDISAQAAAEIGHFDRVDIR